MKKMQAKSKRPEIARGKPRPTMRKEYDFGGGMRGKYARRYWQSNNLVVLSRDVAKYFSDSESVNEALRTLLRLSGKKVRKTA
jgi:hypothetical protein